MGSIWRGRFVLVLCMIAVLMLRSQVATATSEDRVQWTGVISLYFTAVQTASPEWQGKATSLESSLAARVAARGVSFQAKKQTRGDGGLDYTVSLTGSKDLQQFKQVMFDDIEPLGGLLGGPVSLSLSGEVSKGEQVSIVFESNIASGSEWEINNIDGAKLQVSGEPVFTPKGMLLGAPMKQTLRFLGTGSGRTTIVLAYRRPWGNSTNPTRSITLSASRLASLTDLSNPNPVKSAPAALSTQGKARLTATGTLPSAWDWRAHNGTPPIRDQGNCGSCWAFGTLGAFESALMIQGGMTAQDLSEQFLISCNKEGWGCNGGWWAHDYALPISDPSSELGKNQTDSGGVMNSALPYNPGAVCPLTSLPHPFKLSDWAYVLPSNPMSVPPADAIKDAIYNHGPISAAMCVGSAFGKYSSGVFNTDEKSTCGGDKVNHAIVLVGWDDSNNTWILRNSWGTGWGESGYMEIARTVSNVGFGANYVDYPSTPGCLSLSTGTGANGGGSVRVDTAPNCSNGVQYTPGTTVTLTAVPNTGFVFSGWSGGVTTSVNPLKLTINGNTSVVANFASTTQTVGENDVNVRYNIWRGVGDPLATGGTFRVSNLTNGSATFKFTGTGIKWITRKGPDQGKAQVSIDGVNKGTFDLYSAGATANVQLSFTGLANKVHKLIVKVLGTQNASATDHNVAVDGFIVGGVSTPDGATTIQYDSWVGVANAKANGGSYRYSRTKGATATFSFSGKSISWVTEFCPACGKAEVFIDGVDKGTVDTFSPSVWKYLVTKSYSLSNPGPHTIQIKVLGTKNGASTGNQINVDAFQYSQ